MIGKKDFITQIEWNLYNPKNFILSFLKENTYYINNYKNKEILFLEYSFFLTKHCQLRIKGKTSHPDTIEFHKKYGWILGKKREYAFLGKIDIGNKHFNLIIGASSYISGPSIFYGPGNVKIGSCSCIAENLKIVLQEDNHDLTKLSFIKVFEEPRIFYKKPLYRIIKKPLQGKIVIENNV